MSNVYYFSFFFSDVDEEESIDGAVARYKIQQGRSDTYYK